MTLAVLHSRDDDGRSVVGVPLTNRPGAHAWLYETDHAAIVAEYGHRAWFVNDNGKGQLYVRLRGLGRRRLVMVARLVVADPLVRLIRYRDGDRLNLRSRNLDVLTARELTTRRTLRATHVAPSASPLP
ncbi:MULTISPECIES: hypothetical protein [Methylobacterium]|uniref:SsgA family sporulation/cell division regulator n=1 Tax=Methylobacterium jeotgali TaxID=381630 RepID=A0ABQ4STC1_9HYPH|nr:MULTISPECIES: hypothetical protein [Methylobacterium]PIU05870.1 MAG: hypothetical protein COT56_12680 [Methylobacterium sp. CG09_land_8_20_14_0_10_71_15]PIU16334.1 MAG: hypothetical protein COT28_00825 [Methylobacterium sp. CG08_land_8_20_14_0_20_71_15]GBU19878.1 hypothetical protein AwMethylo_40930 [Methylobacterium sp.]GJE06467.1 hypothetical protein AOPFMNJM_1787 [Methylobacterium jeotgali]